MDRKTYHAIGPICCYFVMWSVDIGEVGHIDDVTARDLGFGASDVVCRFVAIPAPSSDTVRFFLASAEPGDP